ncbi:MAG: FKBP-type peptidyl-prolyl cis-trans isomerase [Pseudomonadota bacterium]|nr:FKBP-type peptidyl-prolyl cis-trans isomerase [Pseudomonadota bacterium]
MKKTILSILCLLTLSANAYSDTSVEVLQRGTGPKANNADQLLINYHLWLFDSNKADGKGKLVEKNTNRGQPSRLLLKKEKIIAGLYTALLNQETGSKLKIVVPPELAYGPKKEGEIPANATLVYEMEILLVMPQK